MTDVPHFQLPFRFATPAVAVVEQDSIDEIANCCLAVLLCPQGFRRELPEFGLPDPAFELQPLDLDQIVAVLERWEPRAAADLTQNPDLLDALIAHVQVSVRVRSES